MGLWFKLTQKKYIIRYDMIPFKNKSTHGIATPKPAMDVIREWLKVAELHFKGER